MIDASASNAQQPSPSGTVTTADGQEAPEKFLTARGLDPELAAKYGCSASGGRIEIAFIRDGQKVYSKYRGIEEKTFSCDAGHKPFFWNFDVLKYSTLENEPLIITEGEFDGLAAIQAGFVRTVSVPNGASVAKQEESGQWEVDSIPYLDEVEYILRKIPQIILATDGDEKGIELMHHLSRYLGRARCKWVTYPKGCKDLNDALRLYGVKGVQQTIQRAAWVEVKGARKMSAIPPAPYSRPYSIGIPGFENHLNLRLGDFSVITGIPGHGKSTFVNDVMCRMATDHGFKIAFASFEQSPQVDHKRSLRTWHAGKLEKYMTPDEKAVADAWIDEKFLFITPDPDDVQDEPTLEWVMEIMSAVVIRDGVKIIVLDPWNEMTHIKPRDMTLTEYTGAAIRQLKRFAAKNMVHLMVVAHPAKLMRGREGKYPIPTLYDISDSQHWYNKADLGVIVHRDTEKGDSVIVAKSRYHTEIGRPGVIDVKFDFETGRYTVVDNQILRGSSKGKKS